MLQKLADETNLYAMSQSGIEMKTTQNEIETFIGMYLRMGIMKARAVRAYWATSSRYPPVADCMVRNRSELLCRHIHFVKNDTHTEANNDHDRVWKIRPWLDDLNSTLKKLVPTKNQCVDEIMVSFKGRCTLKQYIRNKPHKRGFKLWARCGSDGILHDIDVYQGSNGAPPDQPLVVGVANVNRWDKKAKKKVEVHCPAVIRTYNKHMGGVDFLDSAHCAFQVQKSVNSPLVHLLVLPHHQHDSGDQLVGWYRRHCKHYFSSRLSSLCGDFQQLVADAELVDGGIACPVDLQQGSPRLLQSSQTQERRPAIRRPPRPSRPYADARHPGSGARTQVVATKVISRVVCQKCNIHLCLNKERNCLRDYHTKKHTNSVP
ncbi:hypothetical protein RRG08_045539 [Elysia crispata]|uniref:PiggyBac transposable element-derived protein domain-containing protein n=1 Tax=Elysia crispata TaxID=231223 RepID=A0AAE0ZHG0_9GAST|nr:hypothetical protein RRG08_045539 [Elysia crispata]